MADASSQLVVSLGLNSTDFQKKIKVINQKMKEFEAEFKSAETAMGKFGDKQEKLSNKLSLLSNNFVLAERKVQEYKNEIKNVESTLTKHLTAHERLENRLKEQRQQLQLMERTLGSNSKEYLNLRKEIKNTEDALRRKANAVAEAESRISRHNTALKNAEKEYSVLRREIALTKNELNNLKLNNIANNFLSIGKAAGSFGQSMSSIGNSLTIGVTAPIVGFGTLAAKTFFEFEQQVRRVNAISSSETMQMGERFNYLSEQTRKFGRETEWTAVEVGQAYEYFAMAGKSVEEATEAMGPMLNLASIGMLDLGEAADIVTDTMTPFAKELNSLSEEAKKSGKDFNEAEWIIDRFAATIVNSNTNISLMGETMKYAAPTVASLGGDFDDLAVAVGAMANAGIKGSMAGTSLATGLNRLVKPAKAGKEAMKKYGIELKTTEDGQVDLMKTMEHLRKKLGELDEVERGRAVTAIFGQTAQKGWLSIINAEEKEWQNLKKAIEGADGATEQMMEEMKKSGSYGFKVMSSAISDLLIVIGDALAPALVSVGETIGEVATKISNWVKKMQDTNPELLETIGKFALFAAAAGPVLTVLGLMTQGFSGLFKGLGGGIKLFTGFTKKIAEVASTSALGASKFGIFTAAIGISGPALIAAAVAALVGLMTTIGNNEDALAWLIDKWGVFGSVISRVCEFVAGVVQLTFGNVLTIIGGIGKGIVALVTGNWKEIDDIIRETGGKIQTNTKEAWSNIKGESSTALKYIRNMTETDMQGVKSAFEGAIKTLPQLTRNNLDQAGAEFANLFKSANGEMLNLSDSTIKILRGTSDTMSILFSGIKGNMNIDEARLQFVYNMSDLLNSGKTSLSELESEFKKAGDLISSNMANSFERTKTETSKILGELGQIARDGMSPVADDIVSIIEGMSSQTIETIRGMGTNWNTLFQGISSNGSMTTAQMKEQILSNMQSLSLDTPEKIEAFKTVLVNELNSAKTAAEQKGKEIGTEIPQSVAEGTARSTETSKEAVKNSAKTVANGAEQGMKEGLANLPNSVSDELAKAGITINNQGQLIVDDMAKKGGDAGKAYVDTLNKELPGLSGVAKTIQGQLEGINSVSLGGTTKQLSEVNRWLGVVQQKALQVSSVLKNLNSSSLGGLTSKIQQIDRWLVAANKAGNNLRVSLINVSNIRVNGVFQGIQQIDRWCVAANKAAINLRKSLLEVAKTTFAGVTVGGNGIKQIDRWLVASNKAGINLKSTLISMSNVRFGGLINSLSSVNKWLSTIRNGASSARSAVASIPKARNISAPVENKAKMVVPQTLMPKIEKRDLTPYQMNYNKNTMPNFGPKIQVEATAQQGNNGSNDQLLSVLMDLVKVIGSQQINVGVNMNGKTLATATAPFIRDEINKIDRRSNRLAGI